MLKSLKTNKVPPKHEHEWKDYKQTVIPQQRTQSQVNKGMDYKGGYAYFTLRACVKCKAKIYLDYSVEKG